MNLAYNDVIGGINNTPQFNGNISATTWSANQGFDNTKENAYKFEYDPLNRLTGATHQEKVTHWAASTSFHENNLSYDLNGNILSLSRKGQGGATLDVLTYDYGQGIARSNQLLKVSDTGDNVKGFIDGANTSNDYDYDANGNMIHDLNKGIGSALTDNTNKITYNHLNLPAIVQKSSTQYLHYTYDATGRKLRQHMVDGAKTKTTDYAGEFFYENDTLKFINHEEGRIVMTGAVPEYQYHLKDHLGNVRLTFTTKNETESATGTLEDVNATAEQGKFLRYANAKRIQSTLFDKTNGAATGYAERLNGSTNERYGLAKSLSVMPGDTLKLEVYAKYIDQNSSNWTTALNTLISQIASGSSPTVVDGGSYSTSTSSFPYAGLLNTSESSGTGPKAYLNWLIFDRDYNFVNGGYQRMSDAAKEYGQDVAHEKISATVPVTQAGYVYIYLSNEETTPVEVYFDEMNVTQIKSPVISMQDYYPFGLAFNEYTREQSLHQDYKYNGKEEQNELGLGWLDYGARMYMPEIGRWGAIDPHADKYVSATPYNYAFNSPINIVNPDGKDGVLYIQVLLDKQGKSTVDKKVINAVVASLTKMFKGMNVDLKVEAHYSNKIMSKKDFYSREGADKTDSYMIIGNSEGLHKAAKETTSKGWEKIWGEGDQDFSNRPGESAENDYLSFVNSDFTTRRIQQMNRDGLIQDDYENSTERTTNIVAHEAGHPKFKRDHPNAKGSLHTPGTIMQELPMRNSKHDAWMIQRLKNIHGAIIKK